MTIAPSQQDLSERELELLTVHLPYELNMLDFAFVTAGSKSADGSQEDLCRLMAIDCFYLHARNLIEFYKGTKTEVDASRTAGARRFTTGAEKYPGFSDYMALINDQVTHVGIDRGTHAKKTLDGQDLSAIKNNLDLCLQQFQDNLTAEASDCWARRAERNYCVTADVRASACNDIYAELAAGGDIQRLVENEFVKLNTDLGDKGEIILWLREQKATANS